MPATLRVVRSIPVLRLDQLGCLLREALKIAGVQGDEVHGKSLLNLDIGLPIQQMRDAIRACIAGTSQFEETVLEATNRRGKKIRCRVSIRPLTGRGRSRGAMLLIDEVEP